MFHCYVLRSQKKGGRRYVGSCEDRDERLRRHNAGESKATKHGVPWVLVHSEEFLTRREAIARERYYKTGRGRDELSAFVIERSPRRQVARSNPVAPIFSPVRVGASYQRRYNSPGRARVSRKRTLRMTNEAQSPNDE
jgi:putative endonuclease